MEISRRLSLFQLANVEEIKTRLAKLTPDRERVWGTMTPAQALAHCAAGLETAVGDRIPPRGTLADRLLGRIVKHFALGSNTPMRRNSPTTPDLLVQDQRDFPFERERLSRLIDRFVDAGPLGCTRCPHSFFGRLTPEEWGELMYKHLDHHLRQFGA